MPMTRGKKKSNNLHKTGPALCGMMIDDVCSKNGEVRNGQKIGDINPPIKHLK